MTWIDVEKSLPKMVNGRSEEVLVWYRWEPNTWAVRTARLVHRSTWKRPRWEIPGKTLTIKLQWHTITHWRATPKKPHGWDNYLKQHRKIF